MSCGCGENNNNRFTQNQPYCGSGDCYIPQQPEKIRMTRNVNGSCCDCARPPRTCTRRDWLRGIDCSCWSFDISNCEIGVEQGAIAPLRAVFRDGVGNLVDPIEPRITIKDPYNVIYLSSQPMARTEQGKYVFMFGTNGQTRIGVWTATVTGVVGTIRVTDTYYFAVLQLGSIPFDNCPDGYGFDGYGDCYGYGYGGIQCGADGYGTFAGREECGFDGNRSKDIPSTGGCRTNRNPKGDGFWDGISYEDQCVIPIGKRGQCVKDKCVAMLRVRLKDIVPQCWAFTEDELDMQLETSLADFNAWPMFTCYTWDTVPQEFIGVIVLGAQVFSLFAQGLLESGREFTITDNGISFNPPQISGYMQTAASTLLQTYTEMKEKVKANLKPHPAGVGTFRVTSIMPCLMRLRHLRSKQII